MGKGRYKMVMFVSALAEVFPDLPEEFLELLPLDCEECKSPLQISETLTSLQCSNPRCSVKIRMRIKAICDALSIKDFGESRIKAFLDLYGTTNPMDMFDLQLGMQLGQGIGDTTSNNVITNILKVKNEQSFLLWEAVRVQNLPGIQTSAQPIFNGFHSIEDAYETIEEEGVEFISDRLSNTPGEGEIGLRAIQIYETLLKFKDEVIEGVNYLNITSMQGKQELTVVVSDQVGGDFTTKNEFYNYCRANYSNEYHFNFAGSLTKKTEFLIWAGADGSSARYTSKVDKAQKYNSQGAGIPIMTAGQFKAFMESGKGIDEAYSFSLEVSAGKESDDILGYGAYDDEDEGSGLL